MTPAEITAECEYIREERLAILCGPLTPPAWAIALAEKDALEFRKANELDIAPAISGEQISLFDDARKY